MERYGEIWRDMERYGERGLRIPEMPSYAIEISHRRGQPALRAFFHYRSVGPAESFANLLSLAYTGFIMTVMPWPLLEDYRGHSTGHYPPPVVGLA